MNFKTSELSDISYLCTHVTLITLFFFLKKRNTPSQDGLQAKKTFSLYFHIRPLFFFLKGLSILLNIGSWIILEKEAGSSGINRAALFLLQEYVSLEHYTHARARTR
ncbi:unnamed protein product [Rhizopus microsporus]